MPDLYAALDLPRGADRAAVRRAYRKAAKTAHPDAGGSPKQFALVRLAHDTLTDDARRRKYDETGEIEEKPVDTRRTDMMQVISMALDMAMQQIQKPDQTDMATAVRTILCKLQVRANEETAAFQRKMEQTRKVAGRFTVEGENLMETLIRGHITQCETEIAKRKTQIDLIKDALTLLADYRFRFDVPPPASTSSYATLSGPYFLGRGA